MLRFYDRLNSDVESFLINLTAQPQREHFVTVLVTTCINNNYKIHNAHLFQKTYFDYHVGLSIIDGP